MLPPGAACRAAPAAALQHAPVAPRMQAGGAPRAADSRGNREWPRPAHGRASGSRQVCSEWFGDEQELNDGKEVGMSKS
eukprot:5196390-Prymnesium_polylepis.1